MEEHSEELIRIKECYVQLGEDSRGLEQKLREEFEKEKQMLLSEVTSTTAREPVFFIPSRSLKTYSNVGSTNVMALAFSGHFRITFSIFLKASLAGFLPFTRK